MANQRHGRSSSGRRVYTFNQITKLWASSEELENHIVRSLARGDDRADEDTVRFIVTDAAFAIWRWASRLDAAGASIECNYEALLWSASRRRLGRELKKLSPIDLVGDTSWFDARDHTQHLFEHADDVLDPVTSSMIRDKYLGGYKQYEIALKLGKASGTISRLLRAAYRALADSLAR